MFFDRDASSTALRVDMMKAPPEKAVKTTVTS